MFSDFETLQVGDTRSLSRTISEADVRRFVEMTGDDNPLHVDRAYAESTSFKDIVVHGMLGASFISTVIGTQLPGPGALWVAQSLEFLLPVRLGDTLTIACVITGKHERERLLDLDTTITNQSGQQVLTGQAKVKVLETAALAQTDALTRRAKVALVTGGGGGIGREICLALARDGLDVVVAYRGRADRAQAVVDAVAALEGSTRAVAIAADLSTTEGAKTLARRAAEAFGPIDVLVNNASPAIGAKPFEALAWEDIQGQIDVTVKAAMLLAQACLPAMKAQRFGRIVNITSQVIEGAPTPTWTAYAMAKSALSTLSRYLATEVGPGGVTVNCVAPGMTATALIGDIPEKAQLMAARQTPMRRLATPRDVASAVAYLASEDAGFITGQTISVNGGMVMR
ncbi:short-chain dehydrogenase [Caulobacter sp. Root655]|uniref:SDR family oxidoreductase n=1 Tax=Caulobacter sp. Root655 TaxID=1736578 RepID=UPI0006FD861B|nr:SDR family oxidoreductase [Caulobacter sp. Root655]KRA60359.1 short-chain dehydrogenase [Caulobacter sp. Root655]